MPNPDNSKWISSVLGRSIAPGAPMTGVGDLVARRDFWELSAFAAEQPPEVAEVHEDVVLRERDGRRLTAEIYVPAGLGPFPMVLYMHGGWFCMWSAAHVRRIAYAIAARGHVVCNLDYSLAPEHPFPAAVEDAVYAARWLSRNGAEFRGDTSSGIAVAGDSAGATLAASTMIAVFGEHDGLDEGDLAGVDVDFSAAVLLYGVLDYPLLVTEPGSNAGIVEMAGNLAYLGPSFLRKQRHPLVSPVYARTLDRFPPCYLSCGDEDSLLGQSLSMTKALTAANVPTTLSVISGVDHSFPLAQEPTPEARLEMRRLVDWLAVHTNTRGA